MNRAYLAGIMDGEGHIGFSRTRKSYFARVLVVNTDVPLLQDIQRKYGGDIHPLSRKLGWKQAFQWRFSNARCVDFLDSIYPWLRIKSAQADLVFAWDAIRPGKGSRWTPETWEAMTLIMDQSKWLNKRGSSAQTTLEPMHVALQEYAA